MEQKELQSIKLRYGIIGNSPKLNHAIRIAVQVAATDLTVLITGESGTGKESFSKIIHQLSHRKHGNFIAINCGAIPEGTINSELFGHEKGAFTGAVDSRKGYFEETNKGTIFLDEVGELPLETQARLLRVLENKEFLRVGSSKVHKTDVRVVAATNVNLLEKVSQSKFREDLYYRLNTVPIEVPPLRERGEDIGLLFRKFTTDFADNYHVKPIRLLPDAVELLQSYRFPGNIRQLKNLAEQISALEMERQVDAEKLRSYLPGKSFSTVPALLGTAEERERLSERDLLYKVLFEMRKDVTDLKKLVLNMLQEEDKRTSTELVNDNEHLFKNIDVSNDYIPTEREEPRYIPPTATTENSTISLPVHDNTEDIPHQEEEEVLSIEKVEKELIKKALKKNNNKRKLAAQDLGISERTLYRKIKQYELENI
jgi:transcriptional regulator with PAS, ATPase and Fis domain